MSQQQPTQQLKVTPSQRVFLNFPTGFECAGKHSVYQQMAVGGWSSGKALALDTRIPTPHGWTTMGQVQVGDQLYDENGRVCNVTYVTDVMYGHKTYEVTFDNGQKIIADAEHLWKTITIADRDRHARMVLRKAGIWGKSHYSTEDIARTLIYNAKWKTKTHAVALCQVRGESRELPIHPYVLGCWLGDGHTNSAGYTCADKEIIDAINSFGVETKKWKQKYLYNLVNMTQKLRDTGVLGNKHIPRIYQRASIEQRLWLLKGLMDTDGGATKDGAAEFTSTREILARDVWELVNGLGIKAAWGEGRATLNGRYISQKYRIRFVSEFSTFHLSRKAKIQHPSSKKRNTKRWICDVQEVPSVPVKCIAVDSLSHLYLVTESFIPTHNTFSGIQKGWLLSAKYPGSVGSIYRLHASDLVKTAIPEFFKTCPEGWIRKVLNRDRANMVVHLVNGSIIYFNYIRAAGQAGTKSRIAGSNLCWFLVEQAEEISQEDWMALCGRLRNQKAPIRFAMGNANPSGSDWIQKTFFPNWLPLDPAAGVYYRTYVNGNRIGIHIDSEENRISRGGFVDDGFYDNVIANSTKEFVDRYVHASFVDFSGRIYKEYTLNSVHNIEPLHSIPSSWECLAAIDVGGSCAWNVTKAYVDNDGNIIVAGEFDRATPLVSEVVAWIKLHIGDGPRTRFVIDPENKVAQSDLSLEGVFATPAKKNVVAGIQRVSGYLHLVKGRKAPGWLVDTQPELAERIKREGCPRLFVYNTCTTWRNEHASVLWHEKVPNQIKKTNTERFDSVDATSYLVAERPEARQLAEVEDKYIVEVRKLSPDAANAMSLELAEDLAAQHNKNYGKSATEEMFSDGDRGELFAGARRVAQTIQWE